MRPDPRKYLWDALHAAELIQDFARGQSFADYQSDAKLRSAASRVPELGRIVAFRNILIHGYATVDDALVWQLLVEKLPGLQQTLNELIDHD